MVRMALARPALCLYLGLLLSVAYTTAFGPLGLGAYAELREREQALEDNLAELQRVNKELTEELRSLSTDAETVMLAARELGYYRKGDRRVSVQGLPVPTRVRTIGQLVDVQDTRPGRESATRLALLLLPIGVYAFTRAASLLVAHGKEPGRG
jgi:cell division protein FtsB